MDVSGVTCFDVREITAQSNCNYFVMKLVSTAELWEKARYLYIYIWVLCPPMFRGYLTRDAI